MHNAPRIAVVEFRHSLKFSSRKCCSAIAELDKKLKSSLGEIEAMHRKYRNICAVVQELLMGDRTDKEWNLQANIKHLEKNMITPLGWRPSHTK